MAATCFCPLSAVSPERKTELETVQGCQCKKQHKQEDRAFKVGGSFSLEWKNLDETEVYAILTRDEAVKPDQLVSES